MAALARGYSFVMYQAETGATYTIPFPFLHQNDIRVFAGDVGDAVEQSYTWTGSAAIQLVGEVPEGILITVRRFTKRDAALVVVQDGAQLPAHDLNLNNKQLLYIIQEQLDFGAYGGSGMPGGGSGWPGSGGSTDPNIQQIIDQVMQSPVLGLLVTRLEDIDHSAEALLEELLRSEQVFDERRKMDGWVALAESTLTTLVDDTSALAQQTTELFTKTDLAAAQFLQVSQALSTETEARTLAITQMTAAYGDADTAIYQTLATTYATKDYAQSVATTAVEALVGGSFAHLEERFEALVDGTGDPDGAWQANWTIRINAGKINGVPIMAGVGLGVDSEAGSNFVVMADRFAFVSPTYTSSGGVQQMKYPFVVGTVGGVSTVGISGQLVVDGSISADKITTNTLSAISANMGEVNGGTFRTFQLDGNGAVINPLEFRAELTNKPSDNYPVWVGAGTKTWNNAVFAVDRDGNAKFSGTVSALNMTDQLQTQATFSWSGDIVGSDEGSTASFTLPPPVRLGESHRPVLLLELLIHGSDVDGDAAAPATVVVERKVGSTWQGVRQNRYSVYKFATTSASMIVSDAATTTTQTYRVRVFAGAVDFHLLAVNGYIFGLR